ncbi:ATP-binding protein [Actinomadura spongiicola]|uniref:ATP-binding protein n=1 Tax=Actinomadura spongiicola TaxID=2303421 RepID=UPI0018F14DF6|nr:ATP-binding protein [Actinomadura spongiicola]
MSWPAEESAAGRARRCVRGWLADVRGFDVDDVELMVSELVTNACLHSGVAIRPDGRVRLVALCWPNLLRVGVTDDGCGGTVPVARRPCGDEVCGRGLMILEALADRWGDFVDPDTGARTVWAEVSGGPRPAPDDGARTSAPCDVVR